MERINVIPVPEPAYSDPGAHARVLAQLERFAWLMDQAITIPGTNIRLGIDPLIGLLPIGGDLATGIAQLAMVLTAHHHFRLPKAIITRMTANVAIDFAVGSIPLLGDLFDVRFKANSRNLALLKRHLAERGNRADS